VIHPALGVVVVGCLCVSGFAQQGQPIFQASFDTWAIADTATGNRVPVRVIGSPTLGPGRIGRGLQCDGASYVEFSPSGNIRDKAGTLCFWVRLNRWGAKTYDNIVAFSDSDRNSFNLERADPDGRLRLIVGGPDSTDGSKTRNFFSKAPLTNDRWYHIAVTWDTAAPAVELYLDGELQCQDLKPGRFPASPPSLIVGAGFGRLARAVCGTIDDLKVYDRRLSAEQIAGVMNQGAGQVARSVLTGKGLLVDLRPGDGSVTVGEQPEAGGRWIVGPLCWSVKWGSKSAVLQRWQEVGTPVAVDTPLGKGSRISCVGVPVEAGKSETACALRLQGHVQTFAEVPVAVVWLDVTNTGSEAIRVGQVLLSPRGDESNVALLMPTEGARIFTDSAGLTGSGVHLLCGGGAVSHVSHGATIIADSMNDTAFGLSGVSFQTTHPRVSIQTVPGGGPRRAEVSFGYDGGYKLAPGQTMSSERVAVHLSPARPSSGLAGHAALEQWADVVMAVSDLKPPRHCPSGYNSWYSYRLTISEELVLANARIIQKRFAPLGATNFQIDHGWQYKDICGHWVPNDRFPHGFPWLADELKKMGLSFGVWTAVSQMSEFAPFYKEHPEALARDGQGKPLVTDHHWFWVPHGKCFLVDPTHPMGEAFYEQAGKLARQHGSAYLKNDFQGNLLMGGLMLHDADVVRGIPVWRRAMAAFRRGMGEEMAYHACNAPLNAVAGLCDVAWVHVDLGNPRGAWDWLADFTNHVATRYHVSGKFYWSDPDYLQVGQGDLAETQWRVAFTALGGGPTFLCDRLPELPEDRLAMIPWVLPGYQKVARPIDLFDHEGYARQWHLPVKTAWGSWDVLGLFNLGETSIRLPVRLERLGLDARRPLMITEFFSGKPLGLLQAPTGLGVSLDVELQRHQTRLLRLTPIGETPTVVGTDMHVTQGGVELSDVSWDEGQLTLRGKAKRVPGMKGRVFVYVPPAYAIKGSAVSLGSGVFAVDLAFEGSIVDWSLACVRK